MEQKTRLVIFSVSQIWADKITTMKVGLQKLENWSCFSWVCVMSFIVEGEINSGVKVLLF